MAEFYNLKKLSSLLLIFHGFYVFGQSPDTLPVVVHVIHTGTPIGSPGNPGDNLIQDMVNQMNNAFQKNGPFYGGANIGLAFELAHHSPNCEPATGINRINGSTVPDYVTGGITTDTIIFPNSAHELFVKALSRWTNTDYINIWIVNMIDGNPGGIAGYAYYPQYNSALTDGIVLRADAVNGTNKTIIHELGHFFNLEHTFGIAWNGCQVETNCTTQGDLMCDTEQCMFMIGCTGGINPCTEDDYIIADPSLNYTVLNNYMGYTDCQWMFTEDQKDAMLEALEIFRPGLLNSSALQSLPGNIPVQACVPSAVNGLSPFYGIERVEFGSMNVYSNSSLADGSFYIDRSCNQQTVVHAGDIIPIHITGSYENFQHIRVYLDFDGDGGFEEPGELILFGSGGNLNGNVVIPSNEIQYCTALRLRVVSDHPSAPVPSACLLTGTVGEGVGQIEDFGVIILPRQVASVASGDWDDPVVWSCNCIPVVMDAVRISTGNLIVVPLPLGNVGCSEIHLQPGAGLNAFADLKVAGGCD